jgi:hypothetical protein
MELVLSFLWQKNFTNVNLGLIFVVHSEFLMAYLPQDANRAADATVEKKCGRIKSKKRESPSTFSPKISERKVL